MAQPDLSPVSGADPGAPELSVVVTLYDEAGSLDELYRRTVAVLEPLDRPFELIFVDDGSTDGDLRRCSSGSTQPTRASAPFASSATSASTRPCTPASRVRAGTSS